MSFKGHFTKFIMIEYPRKNLLKKDLWFFKKSDLSQLCQFFRFEGNEDQVKLKSKNGFKGPIEPF